MATPRIILIGPPGSGKSTVGRLLAQRWGVGFRDLDADLAQAQGKAAGELVVELGRERFQALELDVLRAALAEHDGVLALGGGTPTAPGVAELLRPYRVAFLDVELDDLLKREGLLPLHPWLMPNPRAHLRKLLAERRPVYEAVATATVSTSGRSAEEVADRLESELAAATATEGEQ